MRLLHTFVDTVAKPLWLSGLRESWLSTSFCTFARASRQQALCVALVPDHTVCATPPPILEQQAKDVRHHLAQSVLFLKGAAFVSACSSVNVFRACPHPQPHTWAVTRHRIPVTLKQLKLLGSDILGRKLGRALGGLRTSLGGLLLRGSACDVLAGAFCGFFQISWYTR